MIPVKSLALLAALAAPATVTTADWTLLQLMRSLAEVEAVEASFRERKQLAVLQQPLELAGTLRYRAPDYVEKRVTRPHREVFEVRGDTLTIDTPDQGRQTLSFADYPVIRAFVESIRGALSGDLDRLQRHYWLTLEGQRTDWRLRLEPRDAQLAEYIDAIVISGADDRILGIETLEAGGDRSVMTIDPGHRQ